jgi:hypothetical protein
MYQLLKLHDTTLLDIYMVFLQHCHIDIKTYNNSNSTYKVSNLLELYNLIQSYIEGSHNNFSDNSNNISSNTHPIVTKYNKILHSDLYSRHDLLQDIINELTPEILDRKPYNNSNSSSSDVYPKGNVFINTILDYFIITLIHFNISHSKNLHIIDTQIIEEIHLKEYNNKLIPAGDLLLSRYKHNAESLLMIRCGKCDKSMSLFYSAIKNTTNDGNDKDKKLLDINNYYTMNERQYELNLILKQFPTSDQIILLRNIISFTNITITPSTFISSLYCIWIKTQPMEIVNICNKGILCNELNHFMKSIILLLTDIERRLSAQIGLYKEFPKIYTTCCNTIHCFMCKIKGIHEGLTCEEVQSRMIGADAQYCPGCGVPTLRTEGCHSILCVCGMSWMWQGGNDNNYDIDAGRDIDSDEEDDSDDDSEDYSDDDYTNEDDSDDRGDSREENNNDSY